MSPFEQLSQIKNALISAQTQQASPEPISETPEQEEMIRRAREKLPSRISFLETTWEEGVALFKDQLTDKEKASLRLISNV